MHASGLVDAIAKVTPKEALNSTQKLLPGRLNWNIEIDEPPLAVPGETEFV